MKKALVVLAAALGAVALQVPAAVDAAPNQWRQQVKGYLLKGAKKALPNFALQGKLFTGGLRNGRSTTFNMTINGGPSRMALLAVCDQYCSDVDLGVFSNGKLVAQDTRADDFPVVAIAPGVSGNFQVTVVMRGCKTSDACYYGIGLFKERG